MLRHFKLNNEGRYSITKPYESNQVLNFIKKIVGSDLSNQVITDATACMGGDTVTFSRHFKWVNSIEISSENFEYLEANCNHFGLDNVNLFNQDYCEIFEKLKQNIIYLDPPWGGIDYRYKSEVDLCLGKYGLWDLISTIRCKVLAKHIFIKVPTNVRMEKVPTDQINIYNISGNITFKVLYFSSGIDAL